MCYCLRIVHITRIESYNIVLKSDSFVFLGSCKFFERATVEFPQNRNFYQNVGNEQQGVTRLKK